MKVFMITWVVFCFLVIVGLFIAYATDNLPGVPVAQSGSEDPDKPEQVGLEIEDSRNRAEECSPCEENLKRLIKARERWERERKATVVAGTESDAP